MKLHENQEAAVVAATSNRRCTIIQGGAGTGKTTIVAEIIRRLGGSAVDLCAPTGKAAARMREATGTPASTIHRLLEWNGSQFRRKHLHGLTIIVDEATMVSSWMMAEIMRREPQRLVLVGDVAQLPPVEAGQPFHDLVHLRPDLVAELAHCYRAKESVYKAATAIRHGQQPARSDRSDDERWDVSNTGSIEDTHQAILDLVRRGEMEFARGVDVIVAPRNGSKTNREPGTVRWLNHEIARLLIPRDNDTFLCVGDRVMNTENNPDKDIWNGTTGTVADLEDRGGVWIQTDQPVRGSNGAMTTEVRLTKDEASKLDLAYALTVHKSQGSQYDRVVFVCHQKDTFSLSRSLVYTAVTRTRRECLVMGDYGSLCAGIRKQAHKTTILQHMLQEQETVA